MRDPFRQVRLLAAALISAWLITAATEAMAQNVCSYGLWPRGISGAMLPREAKQGRGRAIAAARRLLSTISADQPLMAVQSEIADLILLGNPVFGPHPQWRITGKTGSLIPTNGAGLVSRKGGAVVVQFPAGADLALNIRAVKFRGRVSEIRVSLAGGRPRVMIRLLSPVSVGRMYMTDEKNCGAVEFKLEEK
jgi:hypothetical protein